MGQASGACRLDRRTVGFHAVVGKGETGARVVLSKSECRLSADTVAKVENRATRKISRKLIFGLLRRCVAFQRHYGGPWSILDETIWSLTSPLVKRISGSKKFRSSPPKKTFATISAPFRHAGLS